jgi:Xaa-Pro aminopeptidase
VIPSNLAAMSRNDTVPFDQELLEQLLDRAGIDLLFATSEHNVQYLTGGYRPFFFSAEETIALSRRVPVVGYPAGQAHGAFYVGHTLERDELLWTPLWIEHVVLDAWTAAAIAEPAVRSIRSLGLERGTIAYEGAFLPVESYVALRRLLPEANFVDEAGSILEDLRMIKQPHEIALLRDVSEKIVASMVATLARARAGITTAELEESMRAEETARGLDFDYCLVTTGADANRAPSDGRRWERGMALSLDSGGRLQGYLGDLARMAVLGEPTALQQQLLREVTDIQEAARSAIRPGAPGIDIYRRVEERLAASPFRPLTHFIAEGIGLVGHEGPRIAPNSPLPSPGEDADLPLAPGMTLSVETTITHPEVGMVKLEDLVIVTAEGHQAAGDGARDWTVVD